MRYFRKSVVFLFALALFPATAQELSEEEATALKYGLDSEITALLARLAAENAQNGGAAAAEVLDLFSRTKSPLVRAAAAGYFTALKDGALVPEAVETLRRAAEGEEAGVSGGVVAGILRYVTVMKAAEAAEAVRALLDRGGADTESWFDAALGALGAVGDSSDAPFLSGMLSKTEVSSTRKAVAIRSLGELKAAEAVDDLTALASDREAGIALRVQAAEALGLIGDTKALGPLLALYKEASPFLRAAAVKGVTALAAGSGGEGGGSPAAAAAETRDSAVPDLNSEAASLVLSAIRDDQWRVRLEGISGARVLKLEEAAPFVLQRAKADPEQAVRFAAFDAAASFHSPEGAAFLEGLVKEKKTADTVRVRAAAALAANGKGAEAVKAAALEAAADDKKKPLRYALGRELAKTGDGAYAEVCAAFLASKDVATVGTGLDMWAKGRYEELRSVVAGISEDEKAGTNRRKAQRLLGGSGESSQSS